MGPTGFKRELKEMVLKLSGLANPWIKITLPHLIYGLFYKKVFIVQKSVFYTPLPSSHTIDQIVLLLSILNSKNKRDKILKKLHKWKAKYQLQHKFSSLKLQTTSFDFFKHTWIICPLGGSVSILLVCFEMYLFIYFIFLLISQLVITQQLSIVTLENMLKRE